MKPGFAFIFNLIAYGGRLPRQIIPGVSLDLATPEQSSDIVHFLLTAGKMGSVDASIRYITKPFPEEPKGGSYEKLEPKDVKFWVLNAEDHSQLPKLEEPFLLMEPDIEWGATFYKGGRNHYHQRIFHFLQSNIHPVLCPITDVALDEVAETFENIHNPKGKLSEANAMLGRVLQDFATSRSYVRLGHNALLSHFGCIEALITHNPEVGHDSLTHQISSKVPLLARRFTVPLNPKQFFKIDDSRKLWKRLYAVRSAYAHGDVANFKSGPLTELVEFQRVEAFVYLALKRLIKQALREPDLVYDLKAC